MRTITLITVILSGIFSSLFSQNVYLSRVAPGFPGKDNDVAHRIELFNESNNFADISGYFLLTRYYSFQIPDDTYIRPFSNFSFGLTGGAINKLDLVMPQQAAYKKNSVKDPFEGDYVVILDRNKELVDAFYFSKKSSVSFLPAIVDLPNGEGKKMMKEEGDESWSYLRNEVDPVVAFVKINGSWRANSRTTNFFPATNYRAIQIKEYKDGFVTLSWQTMFELDCFFHYVERSLDGKNFKLLEKVPGRREGDEAKTYEFYDTKVDRDRVYFYRVTHYDKFGEVIHSPMAKVRTDDNPSGFSFEIIRGDGGSAPSINVRFASKQRQSVRIKLLDEELRELAFLYDDDVEAEKQNLISYSKPLPIGKYFIVVVTENQRYYEPLVIE
ncbi:MAG: lamin tail domain-containing protein [Bacteroidia bacterium]|nr:lamin tail domain-containing protein [Bacteroidia bacterium]